MDIIKESEGVGLVVESIKLTETDKELISKAISHYKAMAEELNVTNPKSKPSKRNSHKLQSY